MSKEIDKNSGADSQQLNEGANQEGSTDSVTDVKDRPAASGAQNFAIIAIAGLIIIGIIYYFFVSNNTPDTKKNDSTIPVNTNKPQTAGDIPVPLLDASTSPSAGEIVLSTKKEDEDASKEKNKKEAVPLPPSVGDKTEHAAVLPPEGNVPDAQAKQAMQQQQAKLKSNIMLRDGGAKDDSKNGRDASANFTPTVTGASSVKVTKVGDLSYIVAQGKIIDAVLETPINTSFPGPVRAVVSRDVYSEKGENVLVPKGSRLIGTFAQGVQNGHARVAIQWTRIVMPNGYDINMTNALAVDGLGQVGAKGDIHREFFGIIGNAVLLSLMNVALAKEAQKKYNIQSSQTNTTTNPDGSTATTTNINPTQQAAQQEVKKLGSVTEQWFKDNFQVQPYVTIDQGTVVKVFVNQDVQFPSKIFSGVNNLG